MSDGSCQRCKSGWSGQFCEERATSDMGTSGFSGGLIAGMAIGIAVVITAVVVLVIFLKRYVECTEPTDFTGTTIVLGNQNLF
jgi:hypothetical protein